MRVLCQALHVEFAKVKAAQEDSSRALDKYLHEGRDLEKLQSMLTTFKKATQSYETFCKTQQQLPDGRAIWLPDYLALENFAELNDIKLSSILKAINAEGINPESSRLVKLDLRWLKITSLGNVLAPLSKLQELSFLGCERITDLGTSLEKLTALRDLCLWGCTGLGNLGISLETLTSLQTLNLRGCEGITDLGTSLDKLTALGGLYLAGCSELVSLGSFIEKHNNLTYVDIISCPKLPESERQRLRSIPNCIVQEKYK